MKLVQTHLSLERRMLSTAEPVLRRIKARPGYWGEARMDTAYGGYRCTELG